MPDVVLRDLYLVGYALRLMRRGFSVPLAPTPTPLLFQFEHHILHMWAVAITHAVRRLL